MEGASGFLKGRTNGQRDTVRKVGVLVGPGHNLPYWGDGRGRVHAAGGRCEHRIENQRDLAHRP